MKSTTFGSGETLYVRSHLGLDSKWDKAASTTVLVTDRIDFEGCPHYIVTAPNGETWRLPQIHLSRRPIKLDK
jgi:hypothetical protein